jgi:hypothetical protein
MSGSGSGAALLRAGYRQVLRVHREKLAPPMRGLGDTYAGKEFREWGAASGVTQQQWHEFRSQWEKYTNMLLGVADSPEATSGDIPADALHRMTPEQRAQLERLRAAVTAP